MLETEMDRPQRIVDNTSPASASSIDPVSRVTLQRFGLMTLTIAGLVAWSGDVLQTSVALTGIAAAITTMMAALLQERLLQPSLNRWDEAAAYVGLHTLSRLMSGMV
ncbi:MAG: hypothetical protein IRZ04_20615 [Rhodospirillales bacterium]|nr:hypothetical protein [Rhodospirillales bacterium]